MQVTDSDQIKATDLQDISHRLNAVYACGVDGHSSLPSGPKTRITAPGIPGLSR